MARGVIQDFVQDEYGNKLVGASVTVKLAGTATLATIYTDGSTPTPTTNPTLTDSDGFFRIFVDSGEYDVDLVGNGNSYQLKAVPVHDPDAQEDAEVSAAEAAASAAAALVSEGNASDSEVAAANSEANASNSETAAAASELAAATSETNASSSEVNAATSEANAAASESSASSSETNAAASEVSASSSASSASADATAAEAAKDAAEVARDEAVEIVTGNSGSLTGEVGLYPLGNARAELDPSWMPLQKDAKEAATILSRSGLRSLLKLGDTNEFDGVVYPDRASALAAAGATELGSVVTFEPTRVSKNLLADQPLDGYELSPSVTLTPSGDQWVIDTTAAFGGVVKELSLPPYRSYEVNALATRGTAGNNSMSLRMSVFNSAQASPNAKADISATSETEILEHGTSNAGTSVFVGFRQDGGAGGTVTVSDIELYEVAALSGKLEQQFTAVLRGTTSGVLPASTEIIWEAGDNGTRDGLRLQWETSGDLVLRRILNGGTGSAVDDNLTIGSLAINEDFEIAVSISNTEMTAALNGVSVSEDIIGGIGVSHIFIGKQWNGSDFSGTIDTYDLYNGFAGAKQLETLTHQINTPEYLDSADIVLNGDSYSNVGSTGIGLFIADLGFETQNIGVGGSEFLEQLATFQANPDMHKLMHIWWDGSANGHVNDQTAIETDAIDTWVAAMEHDRWIYVESSQRNTDSTAFFNDMRAVSDYVRTTYGAEHVYDPQPVLRQLSDGSANDEADIAAGRFPRSILYDGVHINYAARRLIALDMEPQIKRMISGGWGL